MSYPYGYLNQNQYYYPPPPPPPNYPYAGPAGYPTQNQAPPNMYYNYYNQPGYPSHSPQPTGPPQRGHYHHHHNQHSKHHQRSNSYSNNNRSSPYGGNNNRGGAGNKANNNNNKLDKRDLPENNKFYCEVCDRGFKTEDKYAEHCATHETCRVDGCNFTAAAKLVEIHYRNFHVTGVDKRVNLKTEEDVKKYIEERKKNFPSKTNVDKKVDFEKEKTERGVPLATRQFGKLKTQKGPSSSVEKNKKNKKGAQAKKSLYQQKIQVLKSRYNKPTLLQRLLADEIRHERNVLLQCVRYVVQNNFFDKKK